MTVPSSAIFRADLLGLFSATAPQMQQFVVREIMPEMPVDGATGEYGKLPASAFLTPPGASVKRSRGASRARSSTVLEDALYAVREFSFEEMVDRTDERYAGPNVDLVSVAAAIAADKVRLGQEVELAAEMQDTTKYPTTGTTGLAVGTPWDNFANATPRSDISEGKEALFNKGGEQDVYLRITRKQHWCLSQCEQILEVLKYTRAPEAELPLAELAMALGVAGITLCTARQMITAPGAANPEAAPIWSDQHASLYVKHTGEMVGKSFGFGRSLVLSGDDGQTVYTYEEPSRNAELAVAEEHVDVHVVFPEAHFHLGNVTTAPGG